METTSTLAEYIFALRRRRGLLIGVGLSLLVISIAVILSLPNVYRSTGTILIEQQSVPTDLVPSTISTYADERIQIIGQRVMTSDNLLKIVSQYDLYPQDRALKTEEAIIGAMRSNILVEMVSADVRDPRSGKPREATIAFTLSFDYPTPEIAQRVASELASLYLSENIRTRTKVAADISTFLTKEGDKYRQQILDLEENLAKFKEENAGTLPELAELNLQMMDRSERELVEVDRQIRALEEIEIRLQSDLSQISPTVTVASPRLYTSTGKPMVGPSEQLELLRTEYLGMAAVYSPEHPDLIKLKKEVMALEKQLGVNGGLVVDSQLSDAKLELAAAKEKYSDAHPDVKRLQQLVLTLEQQRQSAPSVQAASLDTKVSPNPAHIELKGRLMATSTELRSWHTKKQELEAKVQMYEARLMETPQVEREYRQLQRDYESALEKYENIETRQTQAQLGEALESDRKGERFTLIEPPAVPDQPVSPNEIALLFLGFVFSCAGGLGTAAVAESLDGTVRGRRSLTSILGEPPLVCVPVISSKADRRSQWYKRGVGIFTLLVLLAIGLYCVHLFITPLDVAWFALLRQHGL